jgi:hypothetical protein
MTIDELYYKIIDQDIIWWILSNPRLKTQPIKKAVIRPVLINNQMMYQIETFTEKQAFHENVTSDGLLHSVQKIMVESSFKQLDIFTKKHDYHGLVNKRGEIMVKTAPPTKQVATMAHNQKKQYILEAGTPIPFLIALGVMTSSGKVVDKKYNKFKQINRFVEMIDDIITNFDETGTQDDSDTSSNRTLHIIDFGSGKSYLTFALYHYLVYIKKRQVKITGLDLKAEVIADCNQLKNQLGYADLSFKVGDINDYVTEEPISMVISLHACNTATDAALKKAVLWDAKVIMSVPCCHAEFNQQIGKDNFYGLIEHGIIKERVSALMTDAFRSKWLEAMGYRVQLLEFVDMAHTPKNIMIRAIKNSQPNIQLLKEAQVLQKELGVNLTIFN